MTGPFLYAALGDSTGVGLGAREGGYVDRLARRLEPAVGALAVLNLCRSGATSGDVLQGQVPRLSRGERPSLVTLAVGINDVVQALPDESFAVNLEEIAVQLSRLRTAVVLAGVPDLAMAPIAAKVPRKLYERRIEVFNEHAFATATRHGFAFVDLFEEGRRSAAAQPELFCADGFHPSDLGYERWTDALWPAVEAHLGERRAASV